MDQPLFDDLVQSIKEAGQILRGEVQASRRFTVKDGKLREVKGLPQDGSADLSHISAKTLHR